MASSVFLFPVPAKHGHHPAPPKHNRSTTTTFNLMSSTYSSLSEVNLHHSFSFFKRNSPFRRCYATNSTSDKPPEDQLPPSSGVSPKDTLQIFFAVLFWMSLFFWSCAWDRGNSGSPPNKGSQFRK